eukprot:CAMPEP_0184483592 /NCGR_PEP_ID=MMETSP0113_2-20130426/5276_1 /TAXON_ID=91329 /ORGANISM="Norrisiella sphaerica, Strain BC52" /LENGTH=55 /DNA_ID=CAMNT_0026864117 /DNA_START=395 /DNA_END=562 /DNA_ORIENTATION=+
MSFSRLIATSLFGTVSSRSDALAMVDMVNNKEDLGNEFTLGDVVKMASSVNFSSS